MKASKAYPFTDLEKETGSSCSMLHDMGKMCLPAGILHKTARLSQID